MRPPPLDRLLPGLHFSLKNIPSPSPGVRDVVGCSPLGPNLRGFTEKGIAFSTGGILMQGLRHWKANFWGFILGGGRPRFLAGRPLFSFDLAGRLGEVAGRPPAAKMSGRPASSG